MRTAMKELVACGYVKYARGRDEQGHWSTEIEVWDGAAPDRCTENPQWVSGLSGNQSPGNRSSDGQSSSKTNTDSNTDRNTDLQNPWEKYSASLVSLAVAAGAATDDEKERAALKIIYERINEVGKDVRRAHLLAIEQKRPKIYRQARQNALKQLRDEQPRTLKGDHATEVTDSLSYKWLAAHYAGAAQLWPVWFLRPIGLRP